MMLTFFSGCVTARRDAPQYVRNGVPYGVIHGRFRGRWWNFYERGRSFLEGQFYAEAKADLRTALRGRGRDQLWPRTYGMHFIPEYFPHRELGIVYYYEGRYDESIQELDLSLGQQVSARAAHYLGKARAAQIQAAGGDSNSPTVEILSPTGTAPVGDTAVELAGIARDDMYVESIRIDGQPYDVPLSQREIQFSRTVELDAGTNRITVEVSDLAGNTTKQDVELAADVDGPAFSLVRAEGDRLIGVAFDPAGIAAVTIDDKGVDLRPAEGGGRVFTAYLSPADTRVSVSYEAVDSLGNATRGTIPRTLVKPEPENAAVLNASATALPERQGVELSPAVEHVPEPKEGLSQQSTRAPASEPPSQPESTVPAPAYDLAPENPAPPEQIASADSEPRPDMPVGTESPAQPEPLPQAAPEHAATEEATVETRSPDSEAGKALMSTPLAPITLSLPGIREGQAYFTDEIGVVAAVRAEEPVAAIALNGSPVSILAGQRSVQVSRRQRLALGENEIILEARDIAGNTARLRQIIVRQANEIEMEKGRLAIALLGDVTRNQNPQMAEEATFLLNELSAAAPVRHRFTIVDRRLIREALAEMELAEMLSTRRGELKLGRLVPAEVMFAAWVRRDAESLEIVLIGTSTETGVRVAPRVDVAGPLGQVDELLEILGLRLAQELPRVQGEVTETSPSDWSSEAILAATTKPVVALAVANADDPVKLEQTRGLTHDLAQCEAITKKFTVVGRDVLGDITAEQALSKALATAERRLAPDELVPADALLMVTLTETDNRLHAAAEGVNTATGASLGVVTAETPIEQHAQLLNDLAAAIVARFAKALPSTVSRGRDRPQIATNLATRHGIREFMKCVVYHLEELTDPNTGQVWGTKPIIVGEGVLDRVGEQGSSVSVVRLEPQATPTPIEPGYYVVTK